MSLFKMTNQEKVRYAIYLLKANTRVWSNLTFEIIKVVDVA